MAGMSVSLIASFGLGWLLAAAPPQAKRIVPCPPDSADWQAAREELSAFDARMEALPMDGEVEEARSGLMLLLSHRCFGIARAEEGREPLSWDEETVAPALALKTWWRDGGKAYFTSQLELGRAGAQTVVIPPDLRVVLARESSPKHRLASLLCPLNAGECGAETEAWRARAEKAFRPENRRPGTFDADPPPPTDCMKEARKQPSRSRYKAWRVCLALDPDARNVQTVLPLGRIRAPTDGWLVIRGRRGHYNFCDQLDAYHLATGTLYRSSSCSGLALKSDGQVDGAATNAARRSGVKVGRVSPERLRELLWMLLLAPEVDDRVQVEAVRIPVPKGLRVEWPATDDGILGGVAGGVFGGSTAQTQLSWKWFPPGGAELLSGTFTYPNSWAAGEDHANVLMREAEATLQEGCPALPVPVRELDFTREPGVNRIDAPEGVSKVQDARVDALLTWKPPAGCVPGKNGG
ncbi:MULTISPECIES: hypothetical protein [unclassified Corallococcus]|uniref:hypothetical protein n=1 Tax=unclassified Corallococcus TaxID=2685029 RepID=UPI001A8E7415|nr:MULTISPECIES: hypothetical protein [unclassified Corallococcus]MBN9684105.1 hypothetical protein [Corallococcus sp. NCSPR001]WAS84405.1 hypothetical protein O0N60_34645 [Corallococcus sp. NCRR]